MTDQGDISVLSFHATKLFSFLEGGDLISRSRDVKNRIDSLKNFEIADEETILAPGINGKMNEASAAFGLLRLGLPNAASVSEQILCLPVYGDLDPEEVDRVCDIIVWARSQA